MNIRLCPYYSFIPKCYIIWVKIGGLPSIPLSKPAIAAAWPANLDKTFFDVTFSKGLKAYKSIYVISFFGYNK